MSKNRTSNDAPPDEESLRKEIFDESPFDQPDDSGWQQSFPKESRGGFGYDDTESTSEFESTAGKPDIRVKTRPDLSPSDAAVAAAVPCLLVGFVSGVEGALLGGLFGAVSGKMAETQARRSGKPLIAGHVRSTTKAGARSGAAFFSVYQGVKCASCQLRGGKKDVFNTGVAGFAIGFYQGLAAKQPLPRVMAGAATFGVIAMMLENIF
ncbi:hypothetical protein JKP88DRAFT_237635 [Tribonema minus]|uniref:Mitochondrial import inner membrane translocase subunit TIM22 n=1 Tax=Tribonema minus TaxID=303371 RepID=A0A836CGC6_9STRA|nr:hypothetical protein JKP88DRAFT_237635 [Tribonema minus]